MPNEEESNPLQQNLAADQAAPPQIENIEILGLLAKGGMSRVYKAKQILQDRVVAVKVLSKLLVGGEDSLKRFQREAKLTSSLDHPNIVQIISFGVSKDEQAYLVMEYLNGLSLAEDLKQNGVFSLQKFKSVFLAALSALELAHEKGLIHRDLKPENMMLCQTDLDTEILKLVDFGIAKVFMESENETQNITKTGVMLGSPKYMSPEQCQNKPLDGRSDLYSLACVMYETLCGEPLFTGESVLEVMQKQSMEARPTIPELCKKVEINKELAAAILLGLAIEKTERPQTTSAFANELSKALEQTTLDKIPGLKVNSKSKTDSKKQMSIVLFSIALAVSIAAGGMLLVRRSSTNSGTASGVANYEQKNAKPKSSTQANQTNKLSLDQLLAMGDLSMKSANWQSAVDSYQEILQRSQKRRSFAKDTLKLVNYQFALAKSNVFLDEGKAAQADEVLKQFMPEALHDFGQKSYEFSELQFQQAKIYCTLGKLKEAETLTKQVLDTRIIIFGGENHTRVATITELLADISERLGNFDKAIKIRKHSLELWESAAGDRDIGTLWSMLFLGKTLYKAGDLKESDFYLERLALRTATKTDDLLPKDRYKIFIELCSFYNSKNDEKNVEKTYKRLISSQQFSQPGSEYYLGLAYLAAAQYYLSKNKTEISYALAEKANKQFRKCPAEKTRLILPELDKLFTTLTNKGSQHK